MAEPRSEFENQSGGFIGVVAMQDGKPKGISVRPGESVWLSEAEQIATANAPRRDEDNPFQNGQLVLKTKATEIANRRPIGDAGEAPQVPLSEDQQAAAVKAKAKRKSDAEKAKQAEEEKRLAKAQRQAEQPATPVEETGAAISPSGNPTHGKRAPREEVATPEAPAAT